MFRHILVLMLIVPLLSGCALLGKGGGGPTPEEATLTEVGQTAPDFTLQTLTGQTFTLSEQRGRVVLINWFATWCPPCQEEMPHLQKEVWDVFGRRSGFTLVSVARQEGADVVGPFVEKHGLTWNFALDVEREAYAKYAEAFIPRNTVVDKDGRIIFQSNGFERDDFDRMLAVIKEALNN
jgi:peroxiredoxin